MKTYLLTLMGLALAAPTTSAFAQTGTSALGRFEQDAFIGPDNLKESEKDVTLSKDPASSKVVWIENLLPGGRVKAIVFTKSSETVTYSIPAQKVGGYQVQQGCATYSSEDSKLSVSLNNKINCFGMKQSDYDSGVGITKTGGIQAGGTSVGGKGIKTPGVSIDKKGILVDSKTVMAGVQYVGHKQGAKKVADDD